MARSKSTGISSVRGADLDGLHAGLGFRPGLVNGVAADDGRFRCRRLGLGDGALLGLDVLHHVERLRKCGAATDVSTAAAMIALIFIVSSSGSLIIRPVIYKQDKLPLVPGLGFEPTGTDRVGAPTGRLRCWTCGS